MKVAWLFLFLVPIVSAAQLSGTVYDYDLRKVPLAILEVNSSPVQRLVAADGTFEFELEPGEYEVTVSLARRNLSSVEVITIGREGRFVYDVILLPDLTEQALYEDIEDVPFFEDLIEDKPASEWVAWLLVFVALGTILYVIRKKPEIRRVRTIVEKQVVQRVTLAADVQKVMDVLDELGGRASQKDIRARLPYSEAKVSLMVDELVAKGLVKKVRKGRANLILKV